ncbi:hypothetical protein GCM10016234_18700 [Tianweitania populi]|uniref:Uncharacterized protein n=1 Tax=Tianweitania populi TaxID=1607949 RepID=A0A8J3DWI6_9HYPH|nr:hypothetical protein GCM10016234_18700 [Tianweitania populi]
MDGAKAYYADLKARVARVGRKPDEQFIFPGIVVYTDETDEEHMRCIARSRSSGRDEATCAP